MQNRKLVIRVEIADKVYRMTINSDEEEKVRRAAKRIKDEIASLRKRFDTSYVDYLAMAALQIAIENETNIEKLTFSTERLLIEEMNEELEEMLSGKLLEKREE